MEHLKQLFMSDSHFPKHDPRAIELFLKVAKAWKPDALDLAGDQDDALECARWVEGTPAEYGSISTGANLVKQFLADFTSASPKTEDKHYHGGNHDFTRIRKYMEKNAANAMEYITPDILYGLSNSGFQWHEYELPPVKRLGGLFVHHGESISKHAGESVRNDVTNYNVSLVRGHCFSEDTEILTKDGWRSYDNIEVGTEVYTLNRDSGFGEYQALTEKFVYDDFKEMVSVKTSTTDILVTSGHGMISKRKLDADVWEETDAQHFVDMKKYEKRYIPLAAEDMSEGIGLSDEQLRLLAWVLTEGEANRNKDGVVIAARISQSDHPDGRMQRIEKLFCDLGIVWNPIQRYTAGMTEHGHHRNYDAYRMRISVGDYAPFVGWLESDKTPSRELMKMNSRQAKVFIEELVWGDGCKNSAAVNSYQLSSNNKNHIDAFQELCARAGYRSTALRAKNPKSWAKTDNRIIYLTFNTKPWTCVSHQGSKIQTVPYEGKVWCVTVPNHTLLVRRNGKTFITMNSHRMGAYYKTYPLSDQPEIEGYEIGHMTRPELHTYQTVHDWQLGFAYAHILDGKAHVSLVRIKDYKCVVDGKVFYA